ncbi:phage portal protein [Acetobacter persici]|uniref:phage portal protein n=1 Tax=Acetobacter persici TaxID=1076596 RepID=UPI001BAC30E8|nr:phage portal protein [Acetobacter persici]MBS1016878.1 phage portal protein [Acetobacter persici]MCP9321033.1 phage portal protein [Acetobacter persici]
MNIIQKALKRKQMVFPEAPMLDGFPMFGFGSVSSGVSITSRTTLQHHAVYTCVRTLTSDIAKIPVRLEKYVDGGWQPDRTHRLTNLLKSPNDRLVAFEFIEQIIQNVLTNGDSYVVVIRDKSGNPFKMIPIKSFSTSVVEDYKDGELYYHVTDNQLIPFKTSISTENGATRTIFHSDMIRTRNLSFDGGINGVSLIQIASEAFGLALATQQAAARAMNNGSHINGYFKNNGARGREGTEQDQEALSRSIQGIINSGKTAIINGLDYVPIPNNVADLQLIEARREVTQEIARMYRVPLYKLGLGDTEKAANIAEQEQSYITNTLIQYTKPLEQHMDRVLLNDAEKQFYRIKFDFSKQAEPSEAIRGAYYRDGISFGWLTQNEVREREDLAPKEGGDILHMPLNTGVAGDNNATDLGEMDEDKS